MNCLVCEKQIIISNPKWKSSSKRQCCSKECSYKLRRIRSGNIKRDCLNCQQPVTAYKGKYCCNKCQKEYEWKQVKILIETDTNNDLEVGLEARNFLYRRYLIDKRQPKCEECGWSKINLFTGKVPIELDHVDGDCTNNKLSNLKLLCPSCHSLTSTYKGSNKGKGSARYKIWKKRFKK